MQAGRPVLPQDWHALLENAQAAGRVLPSARVREGGHSLTSWRQKCPSIICKSIKLSETKNCGNQGPKVMPTGNKGKGPTGTFSHGGGVTAQEVGIPRSWVSARAPQGWSCWTSGSKERSGPCRAAPLQGSGGWGSSMGLLWLSCLPQERLGGQLPTAWPVQVRALLATSVHHCTGGAGGAVRQEDGINTCRLERRREQDLTYRKL